MNKLKIFIETTLFNYYFDEDRDGHHDTVRMFEAIGEGVYEGYTSTDVVDELEDTRSDKKSKMLALINKYNIQVVTTNREVDNLATIYVQSKAIPKKYYIDGYHIANTTIHKLDCILSFNFKHINKNKTKEIVNEINKKMGYKHITICSPKDVFDENKKE